jgi:excisionase family DNA binding protein
MEVIKSEVRIPTGKACEILGVHPNTLRRWVKLGHIPAVTTPGGERRFLLADLREYLEKQKAEAGQ